MPEKKSNRRFAEDLKKQKPVGLKKEIKAETSDQAEPDLDAILNTPFDVEAKGRPYIKYIILVVGIFILGIASRSCSSKSTVPNSTPASSVNSVSETNPYQAQAMDRIHRGTDGYCYLNVLEGDTRQSLTNILIYLGDGTKAFANSGYAAADVPPKGSIIYIDSSDCTKLGINRGN